MEVTDLIFAVDSIPAIFAVTIDPFIVYTSNVFAILGLRSLYFVLAGMMGMFHYLKLGLGAVLTFVGVKMLLAHTAWKIDTLVSLGVIVFTLAVSMVMSLLRPKKYGPRGRVSQSGELNMAQLLQQFVASKAFHHFIVAVIVLAGVVAGLETSGALMQTHGATLLALDKIILGIFIVEAALKMAAQGRKPWPFCRRLEMRSIS